MKIGPCDITRKIFIIAEIGNNHEGDVELAKRMISVAAKAGVDAVKFQTFQTRYYVSAADAARFARLQSFELTFEQFRDLSRVAEGEGVVFLSTPFDVESADFLNAIVPAFKISSGDNNFYPLLERVAGFDKPLLLSRGLADFEQIRRTVTFVEKIWTAKNISQQIAILHCVSSYPAEPREANLSAIRELQKEFSCPIGYSDHTMGMAAAPAAAALGARIIEKHFTVDKNYSGFRDHSLSADPAEMAEMVRRVRQVETLLGTGERVIQESEKRVASLVRRSIVAKRDLAAGSVLAREDLTWIRPAVGLSPGEEHLVVGKKLKRPVKFGEAVTLDIVE
ncbi:MAG: N-acetylneuraminate synthase family protein [Candidatus Omnitrophota bacterium]